MTLDFTINLTLLKLTEKIGNDLKIIEMPTNFLIFEEKPHVTSTFQIVNDKRDSVQTIFGNKT